MAQDTEGPELLIIEDSWLYSDPPHSVGLLWTRDQPHTETATWFSLQLKEKNIHATGRFRTHKLIKRMVPDPRLRSWGHWNRQWCLFKNTNNGWC